MHYLRTFKIANECKLNSHLAKKFYLSMYANMRVGLSKTNKTMIRNIRKLLVFTNEIITF